MFKALKEFQQLFNLDYSPIFNEFIRWIPRLISGFLIFFAFWLIYRSLRYVLVRGLQRAKLSLTIIELLTKVLKYFIFSLAVLMMANQWGIEIVPLLSTLGVMGIAVGLAAQQTLANLISGIVILISRPFQEGDWIQVEDVFGRVLKISLRSTHLITKDNLLVDYPNRIIVETKIINHTYNEIIRLRVGVGIAYKEYIPAAQQVILGVLKDDPRFLLTPAPEVVVTEIAESSINLELHAWINNPHDEIPMGDEIRLKIKLALDEAGIEIPFPHQQLFIEKFPTQALPG
jgi:small conductance mechanosensitive channel